MGNQNSNLYVIKMDSLGNKIWDRRIGEDGNYYTLYDVLATHDGGCLLSGCVYNYPTGSEQKDIFLVKLDSAGNTTWVKALPMADAALSVFPNPAIDVLNIELKSTNQTILQYSIMDMSAKVLIFNRTDSKELKVNIRSLPAGMYIFEGKTNDGTIISRKFIKK